MKKIFIVIFSVLFVSFISLQRIHFAFSPSIVWAQSSSYEKEFFNIYKDYHSQPTSQEQWLQILGGGSGEYYKIRSGDTLWDISQTLFGDGYFWTKVWSQNQNIKNPHLLKTGGKIVFIPGSESSAPAYGVLEERVLSKKSESSSNDGGSEVEEVEVTEVTEVEVTEVEVTENGVELPPPVKALKPVLKKIPPSLPELKRDQRSFGAFGIDIVPFNRPPSFDYRYIGHYISEFEPQPIGEIIGIEGAARGGIAGKGQYVYILINPGKGKVGRSFTVAQNLGKLKRRNRLISGSTNAYNIENQGRVELLQTLPRKNNHDPKDKRKLFRGIIHEVISSLFVGSILIEKEITRFKSNLGGPRSEVTAEVIGGEFDVSRVIMGEGSIIFLNKGSQAGLRKNLVLPILEKIESRHKRAKVHGAIRQIGWVQIAEAQASFATAVVLQSWDAIVPGDITGPSPIIADNSIFDKGEDDFLMESIDGFDDEDLSKDEDFGDEDFGDEEF